MTVKIYAERDLMALDKAGDHYCRHISAMTAEELDSKSDIAAELGWRDMQIAELQRKYEELVITSASVISELQCKIEALAAENCIQDFIISAAKELIRESSGVAGWHLNGDIASWDEVLPEINHSETPATDAALAEIRAQGVEMFAARVRKYADDEDSCNRKCSLNLTAERAENYSSWMRKESGQ